MLGCNANTPFEHRSVGNSPEFMPLSMSLNNDVKTGHNFHCALTSHLAQNDERKFSMKTPKMIARGIKRLVEGRSEGVPSSERIIHDCDQALNAMRIVMEHNGAIVPGLADQNGHRYTTTGTVGKGGSRVKCEVLQPCKWIHPLCRSVKDDTQKQIVSDFADHLQSDAREESFIVEDDAPTENEHVD